MPELPEVETIKRELKRALIGKIISKVCVFNEKVIRCPSVRAFKSGLKGARIKNILRKGKVLVIELARGGSLVIHLKMTGQLLYPGDGKKSRVSFYFSDATVLDLRDQRLFAEVRLLDDWRSLKFLKCMGPEPFEITAAGFKKRLANRKTRIKPLLLEQDFIAGVGNLYAAESLFRAKIHPAREARTLSEYEVVRLLKEIKNVLREAIRYGGSSVDTYVRVSGEKGGFSEHHKVYDRKDEPCVVCKTLIRRMVLGGRGTYFCPGCQK